MQNKLIKLLSIQMSDIDQIKQQQRQELEARMMMMKKQS